MGEAMGSCNGEGGEIERIGTASVEREADKKRSKPGRELGDLETEKRSGETKFPRAK